MYRLVREGSFPKPLKITASASAFVTLEIQAWIDARIAERDASDAIAGEMQARQVAP
jgi:predicted DNA-binding transcriptional regulator AlpA